MYSQEIEELLKIKQNIITSDEYIKIVNSSPQINHIKYNPFENIEEIDTEDNYHFKIKIKTNNKN